MPFCQIARREKKGDLAYQVMKKMDTYGKEETFTEVIKKWVELEVKAGHFVKVIEGIVGIQTFFLKNHLDPVLRRVLSRIPLRSTSLEQIEVITEHLCRWEDMLQGVQVHWANLLIDMHLFTNARKILNNRPDAIWEEHRRAVRRLPTLGFSK